MKKVKDIFNMLALEMYDLAYKYSKVHKKDVDCYIGIGKEKAANAVFQVHNGRVFLSGIKL